MISLLPIITIIILIGKASIDCWVIGLRDYTLGHVTPPIILTDPFRSVPPVASLVPSSLSLMLREGSYEACPPLPCYSLAPLLVMGFIHRVIPLRAPHGYVTRHPFRS